MSKYNDRANVSATKRVAVWFKLYINDIKIKGSRVTLDNGGVKVHLNLNNLDQPSRASAFEGRGYVKLNTFYAMSLFGMNEAKPVKRIVKDYREAKPLVTTFDGPSYSIQDKAFHLAWDGQLKRMSGAVTTAMSKYDTLSHLKQMGVNGLALEAA